MAPRNSPKKSERKKKAAKPRKNAISKPPRPRTRIFRHKNGMLSLKTPYEFIDKAKKNAESCSLLRLPQEIRASIWKSVFKTPAVSFQVKNDPDSGLHSLSAPASLSLRQTCRQIYAETATTFYSSNVFDFREIANFNPSAIYDDPNHKYHAHKLNSVVTWQWLDTCPRFQLDALKEIKISADQVEVFALYQKHSRGLDKRGFGESALLAYSLSCTFPALKKILLSGRTADDWISVESVMYRLRDIVRGDVEIVWPD
ncbi:hypothetical protein P154DRAFT_596842 [Amniculicola lignicola CBS 123094]|uniref:F-box domain-containing protein n=1 Tax=Amniculicola lignicola CBS 123094 TaxID=1392246 RepID=A0A6A5WHC7_9PLEO|nr:hypothetical protein P154DRAFT_596842 [Amniculicola lignicola CBS 123094]